MDKIVPFHLLHMICKRPFMSVLHAHSSGHIVKPYASCKSDSSIQTFINILENKMQLLSFDLLFNDKSTDSGSLFQSNKLIVKKNRLKQTRNHPVKYNHLKVQTIFFFIKKKQEKKLCLTLLMLFHTCAYNTRYYGK